MKRMYTTNNARNGTSGVVDVLFNMTTLCVCVCVCVCVCMCVCVCVCECVSEKDER